MKKIALVLFLIAANIIYTQPTNGLIAYYPFNGNANDESGYGRNGVVHNALPAQDRFGVDKKAYGFKNGSNAYIEIPNTQNLSPTSNGFSVCVWVNSSDANYLKAIVGKHVSGTGNGIFLAFRPSTTFEFFLDSESGLRTSNSYADGKWHFVAGTYDGSVMKLFVDGAFVSQQNKTYINSNSANWLIGKFTEGVAPEYFTGLIDDIRIYGRALTNSEIIQVYNENNGSAPFVKVISPNGGENWQAGSVQNITWTSGSVDKVTINWSPAAGSTYTIAGDITASVGTYSWTIPNYNSATCSVWIVGQKNGSTQWYEDQSDNYFSITPASTNSISLTSPNGGETWQSGAVQYIRWNSSNVNLVSIEYSTDKGSTWNTITSSYSGSSGSFGWQIPNLNSTSCLVRIKDNSNTTLQDVSDKTFTITNVKQSYKWIVQKETNSGGDLNYIHFFNENNGLAGGAHELHKTNNGGATWTQVNSNIKTNTGWNPLIHSYYFIDENYGWASVGFSDSRICKTTDGGLTWAEIPNNVCLHPDYGWKGDSYSTQFINRNTGYLVGHYAGIGKTNDGGLTWTKLTPSGSPLEAFRSLFFLNEQIGWAVGGRRLIMKTVNGGISWTTQSYTAPNDPNEAFSPSYIKVKFINQTTGWVITDWVVDYLMKSTDGGASWFKQTLPGKYALNDICFYDEYYGWAVGTGGSLLVTTNGGTSWQIYDSGTGNSINSIHFINKNTGWIAGNYGRIARSDHGGVVGIEKDYPTLPENFLLYQNYPNPFNPVTTIKYSIAHDIKGEPQDVRIIIYDILGNQIATLVNERLPAGNYQVVFDGSSLASGVYFCKMQTGSFHQTKKLVLMK